MEIFSRLTAFILIVILLPIFVIVFTLLLFGQGRPILFKHKRVGYDFMEFELYKFRTMIINTGSVITNFEDNRITKIGRILRKLKIDELPQLFNIIKGEMRFIGPRPEVPEYINQNDFNFLKMIKPGMSDYASILFRNEDELLNNIKDDNPYLVLLRVKTELANYYCTKKNFSLDLYLVCITTLSIFAPDISSKIILKNLPIRSLEKVNSFFGQ